LFVGADADYKTASFGLFFHISTHPYNRVGRESIYTNKSNLGGRVVDSLSVLQNFFDTLLALK
jgi:hypothetical protein